MNPQYSDKPPTVIVRRREPHHGAYVGQHHVRTAAPATPQGDPFPRHLVRPGDFFTEGKIRPYPGTHLNIFTNIPGIQAVAEKFFGRVAPTKVEHGTAYGRAPMTRARGRQRGVGRDVNIDAPGSVTHGELATVQGYAGTVIKGVLYA